MSRNRYERRRNTTATAAFHKKSILTRFYCFENEDDIIYFTLALKTHFFDFLVFNTFVNELFEKINK